MNTEPTIFAPVDPTEPVSEDTYVFGVALEQMLPFLATLGVSVDMDAVIAEARGTALGSDEPDVIEAATVFADTAVAVKAVISVLEAAVANRS